MKITFLGAAETVTGAKYLLTSGDKNILVDCGLFQGHKELRLRNWTKLPVDPKRIDAVILTHAHIDHSGYIPLLVKQGFKGKIYCTHATADLCEILLPDSGYLQEEEANFANKMSYSKHHPALPLYAQQDAIESLKHFASCDFNKTYNLYNEFYFQFNRAGHILGASTVHIKNDTTSILFSGDLGRPRDPIMLPPVIPPSADYLVLESTYGNRSHGASNPLDDLADVINRTAKRGGTIVIPAFAVGRAQILIYFIYQLKAAKRIPNLPVFLDSPMAIDATKIFCRYTKEHHLNLNECARIYGSVNYIHTIEESKSLDVQHLSKVIISASGMATGGRVLHHIKSYANSSINTILFAGFQAGGTRGDRMTRGEREIKLLGEVIQIKADVILLNNLSAHADKDEILEWLQHFPKPPHKVFVIHGEADAAQALKNSIEKELRWDCIIPKYLQQEEL